MPIKIDRIDKITANIGKAKILILGDIMLDEYLHGQVNRISPEAPVPVVEIITESLSLGGAANVANNIAALGNEPFLIGTVGQDDASVKLSQLLKEKGISRDFLINDENRRTTIKTRIIAHSQQVVRADREDAVEVSAEVEERIFNKFNSIIDEMNGVIISDYGKGVLTASLLEKVIPICREKNIFIGVDPKESHFFRYKKVSVVTPNHHEAGFVAGRRIKNDADLRQVGKYLLEKLDSDSVLITRGEKGMALFSKGGDIDYFPTVAKKVYDVTGAGDTVVAAFVAAVAAGASLNEATEIANCAAGIVVGEVGTATVSNVVLTRELKHNFANGDDFAG
ncbi:MAG: D-glycero-beta-D-manno-heptose-7-phosphate kinase [candidate division Zixibacteria bacterium HGW-Zixibacteria-1]|nr:MAG: D-glycero-beta-D-manno-heptose-7-phosphate kinase [candidate division Zixibacteria bacterium HGW-Zixibacteria-1]